MCLLLISFIKRRKIWICGFVKSSENNNVGLWEDQGKRREHSSRAESLHGKERGGPLPLVQGHAFSQPAQQHPHPRQDPRVLPPTSALQEKPSAGNRDNPASPAQSDPENQEQRFCKQYTCEVKGCEDEGW